MNAAVGDLNVYDGIDCLVCKNKGVIYALSADGYVSCRTCECESKRRTAHSIKTSGMSELVKRCTFDTFSVSEDWQRTARKRAENYAAISYGWFMACGQVGAGKTHLCVAICARLMEQGREVRFMPWREESARLKAMVNAPDYGKTLLPIKTADVLYIDDFFKVQSGGVPTAGDINLAFEIVNARYNCGLTTIISTEKTRAELMQIDEAVASRIIEMLGAESCVEIGKSAEKNQRIHVTARKVKA